MYECLPRVHNKGGDRHSPPSSASSSDDLSSSKPPERNQPTKPPPTLKRAAPTYIQMEGGSSSSSSVNQQRQLLTEESGSVFGEGISLLLSNWSALQLAVENEWGGRGSRRIADQMVSDIFSWFTSSKEPLYLDVLENILDEAMLSLNTVIEDGSVEEIAEKLMFMHEECLEGNYTSVLKLREAAPRGVLPHQHIRQAADDDDDDDDNNDSTMADDGSDMMVDAPESQSKSNTVHIPVSKPRAEEAQAEDGWTVVSSKRNRGRRN
ncbi:hypothetical protein Tsubulata_049429 [Turnera subulata]|uniref:Pre-rRNA-processing protein TSR2 homolog n=1 Tax=Turnera subulata TaxID=218843 RepID=A0A9Q0FIJ2_9ROSI|nr:hypothetical protein Tsubulata_049429 [Turnera subulata]